MTYNTRQKEIVLNIFRDNEDSQFSIDELKNLVSSENIGLATLYRQVDRLVKDGVIRKYLIEGKVFYKYSSDNHCEAHFHLICNNCKRIIHLSCSEVKKLSKHIEKEHRFKLDASKVVFYGVCEDCVKEGEND